MAANEVGEMPPPPSPAPAPVPIGLASRFLRDPNGMINHLSQVYASLEVTPSAESKLLASLEYILCGMIQCHHLYTLVEDEGWPVPRVYDHVPRLYSFLGHSFTVSILNGIGVIKYILLKCRRDSFRLVECNDYALPTYDDPDTDVRKILAIEGTISPFFYKFDQISEPPAVRLFERQLLNFIVTPSSQLADNYSVLPIASYSDLHANVDNANLNDINRLYRTIVHLFHQNGGRRSEKILNWYTKLIPHYTGESSGKILNWHANLIPDYTGETVHVNFLDVFFYFSLVRGVSEIFLVIRGNAHNFIYGYAIPNEVIPTFISTRCDMYNDIARLQALRTFLRRCLKEIQRRLNGPRTRSSSGSNSDESE